MKRVLAALLIITCLLGILESSFAFAGTSFSSAEKIDPDTAKACYIRTAGTTQYYIITPNITGTYTFYSSGRVDTYAHLYDASKTQITANDDGGDGTNFRISYNLISGNTYYFGVRLYDASATGSCTIYLNSPFTTAPEIYEYDMKTCDIAKEGEVRFFKFVPSHTGAYRFSSAGNMDTFGYIYNTSKTRLTSDDDAGESWNFSVSYNMNAGQTYYLVAALSPTGNNKTGSFTITVAHEHSYKKQVVKPTTKVLGYTRSTCTMCGNVKIGSYTAPTGKIGGFKCKARTASAQTVAWNKMNTASGYQVQISTKDGKKWSTSANLKASAISYTFKKLAAGNNYKFRVRFYVKAADGKNYYSPWSSTLNSPTLPTGTAITKLSPASKAFTAQWKKAGFTGYQIQYATNAKFSKAKTVTVKNAKTLKATVKKLSAKKVYYVRIRTYKTISKANYFSTWSKAYKVKTK